MGNPIGGHRVPRTAAMGARERRYENWNTATTVWVFLDVSLPFLQRLATFVTYYSRTSVARTPLGP